MGSLFSPPKPEPLPEVPKREDPSVAQSRREARFAQRRRRGRAASIRTNQGEGQLGDAPVSRPEARKPELLGR